MTSIQIYVCIVNNLKTTRKHFCCEIHPAVPGGCCYIEICLSRLEDVVATALEAMGEWMLGLYFNHTDLYIIISGVIKCHRWVNTCWHYHSEIIVVSSTAPAYILQEVPIRTPRGRQSSGHLEAGWHHKEGHYDSMNSPGQLKHWWVNIVGRKTQYKITNNTYVCI